MLCLLSNCGKSPREHDRCQHLCDAEDDKLDIAILISGDSDLTSPVKVIRDHHPEKRVVIACPPGRKSIHLCQSDHASFPIWICASASASLGARTP